MEVRMEMGGMMYGWVTSVGGRKVRDSREGVE